MDIRVSGHQIETGSPLQHHASERLNGISEKYFNRAISSPRVPSSVGSPISAAFTTNSPHGSPS